MKFTYYKNKSVTMISASLILSSMLGTPAQAAIELLNTETEAGTTKVAIGGYVKADIRHVEGDIAYQDYWVANFPGGEATDTSHTGFNVRQSRLNFKVSVGEVTGFVEWDYYGGDGNEVVSNSSNERLRHFYITYDNWLIGQTWTTFMPIYVVPEAMDFGGPHVGEVFIRQTMLRYTYGDFQFAIENPETNGDGDVGQSSSAVGNSGDQADPDESIPDFIARYDLTLDWAIFSFGTLLRKVDQGGLDDFSAAFNFSTKIDTYDRDDVRFTITAGEPGRYVAAGLTPDIVIDPVTEEREVESTVAYSLSYRHFWGESLRSTAFYGTAKTDTLDRERSHWGINIVDNLTSHLTVGFEIGNYAIDDDDIEGIDSYYYQLSAKFAF